MCITKPGRKQKDPLTLHLIGGLSEYILEQPKLAKYGNPGNLVVTININEVSIGNTLIDLGAAINVMTATTLEQLQLQPLLRPTPTILELADKTRVIPEGILDDVMVTLASWEYPIYFIVIHSKDPVSTNYCKGAFSLQDSSPWHKHEEMGLKEPIKCILFICRHERQAQCIGEVRFGLKC